MRGEHIDVLVNVIESPPLTTILCVSEDVLVEENQNSSLSLSAMMTPSSATGMSFSMEMPRKRKGSVDNQ